MQFSTLPRSYLWISHSRLSLRESSESLSGAAVLALLSRSEWRRWGVYGNKQNEDT
jgi:hypothetical protein